MYRGMERPVRSGSQLSRIDPQSPLSLYETSILAIVWDCCQFRAWWPIIQDGPHKHHDSSIYSLLLQADSSIPRYIRQFHAKRDESIEEWNDPFAEVMNVSRIGAPRPLWPL